MTFGSAPFPVRPDLLDACRDGWARLGAPGTWWTGTERIAIAAEVRRVNGCELCATRKSSLSPYGDDRRHDGTGPLPPFAVEAVHRIVSDPGRITERWVQEAVNQLGDTWYVELIGVLATIVMVDTLASGIGVRQPDLPDPSDGTPTRQRPNGLAIHSAWVPTVVPDEAEGDLAAWYSILRLSPLIPTEPENVGTIPKITRALTLVPAEQLAYGAFIMTGYLSVYEITQAQEELLASTVSSANGCYY